MRVALCTWSIFKAHKLKFVQWQLCTSSSLISSNLNLIGLCCCEVWDPAWYSQKRFGFSYCSMLFHSISCIINCCLFRDGIHKRDQTQVEPKTRSSLQLFIPNLSWFLAQLELDPLLWIWPLLLPKTVFWVKGKFSKVYWNFGQKLF